MKRTLIILLGLTLITLQYLGAEDPEPTIEITIDESMEELESALDELDIHLEEIENIKKIENLKILTGSNYQSNRLKMGVYLSDLDFQDIYEMHYDYNFGVYITSVTQGGPSQKAGIIKGDIIMEFDGTKVKFEDHLIRLINSKNIGDEVKIKFFRDENIYETFVTLDTLEPKDDTGQIISDKKKKRLSVGDGGGSWFPIWYTPDVVDINDFLFDLGFKEETFSEDGFLIHGGGGKGNVGKGWFLGGMGAGFDNSETTKHDWEHYKDSTLVTTKVSRKVKYSLGYGGVTLDKRYAVSRNLLTSLGFMIGWGGTEFKVSQYDDNGDFGNFDFENDPSGQMDEFYDYKSTLKISQDFLLFQPKVMFMYRILDWLAFRAEASYMVSYSSKGWKAKRNGESIKLVNEPDYNMDGISITVGPWFGF